MYVDGVSSTELFDLCWSRAVSGGIGYYDSHVHLDSGTRRWWVGDLSVPNCCSPACLIQENSSLTRRRPQTVTGPMTGTTGEWGRYATDGATNSSVQPVPSAPRARRSRVCNSQPLAPRSRGEVAPDLPAHALGCLRDENPRFFGGANGPHFTTTPHPTSLGSGRPPPRCPGEQARRSRSISRSSTSRSSRRLVGQSLGRHLSPARSPDISKQVQLLLGAVEREAADIVRHEEQDVQLRDRLRSGNGRRRAPPMLSGPVRDQIQCQRLFTESI